MKNDGFIGRPSRRGCARLGARPDVSRGCRQLLARLPQPPCGVVVAGGRGGLGELALDEVPSRHLRDLGRGGQIDERVGALVGRDEKASGNGKHEACEAPGRSAEAGRDRAGMEAIGGDSRPAETAAEFAREQDVRLFRAGVSLPAVVALRALQIGEVEAPLVRHRGGRHDPRRRGRDELVAKRRRHDEIGHVVQREGELQPLRRHMPLGEHGAGVVDQHVDARLARRDGETGAPGLRHARKVGKAALVSEPRRCGFKLRQRALGALLVARHEHDSRARFGERKNRGLADPGGGAGRNHGLALHAHQRCPSRRRPPRGLC